MTHYADEDDVTEDLKPYTELATESNTTLERALTRADNWLESKLSTIPGTLPTSLEDAVTYRADMYALIIMSADRDDLVAVIKMYKDDSVEALNSYLETLTDNTESEDDQLITTYTP